MLVEAALAAAVIGVGLVFISRAFTSAMRTLQVARLSDTALLLAEAKLAELELEPQQATPPIFRSPQQGTFAAPYDAFEWAITVQTDPLDPALVAKEPEPLMVWMRLEVKAARAGPPAGVTLTTMMRKAWIPEGWTS